MSSQSRLVLIRHGQSTYNEQNLFTGWKDVLLTEQGIREAHDAAPLIADITFTHAFTSNLKRAQHTLDIILKTIRHLGTRQGLGLTKFTLIIHGDRSGMGRVTILFHRIMFCGEIPIF